MPDEWQPISTAPKDRTMIVVKAVNVRVQQGALLYTSDPYCSWWQDGKWSRWGHNFDPTHWCPLPPDPR